MTNRAATVWVACALAIATLAISRSDADTTPGYNTPIPPSIMTPDTVETRLGTLEFVDGFPTQATADACWENLDFLRGVETFLNGIPAASLESIRRAHAVNGHTHSSHAMLAADLMDSNPLFLTGNTDTVYCSAILDLERDGPTVVEIPPKCGPGTVNDAFFRFVIDMGAPGPDRGIGGKYLILPPNSTMKEPEGYYVARSKSYTNWLILRGFLVNGKTDTAVRMFEEGLRIYPYDQREDPPEMTFTNLSKQVMNTIHANDVTFYEELHHVLQKEPIDFIDPEMRGLFASIGLQKGLPWSPDDRMARILREAVAVGNATARTILFRPRNETARIFDDRRWGTAFVGGDYRWLIHDGLGGRNLDARTMFFYFATVNTPAMARKMVGVGSQYAGAYVDVDGDQLLGKNTYKLNIPADVPARDFWSVVIYDPQTRSELQTSQPFPSKNNKRDKLLTNEDGSVDLWFGPKPPAGKEANWIETVPGKGWFAILRLYGPLEPWFEKTWRPGDFELVR